ncbi:chromosome segregation protein [Achromobacter phage JWF]|uniref:chromosome segregation protein n=1 Tax=Achromobacter phage JWF TaxID=1589748 RepID=UPI000588DFD8|nr:chromosome segregation protein [Achromobacter phage JWF]AJD82937.1 chromosome segregation protein [Achromobacter phage JWF]
MLHKIRIQNGYRHDDTTLEFGEGQTAIIGKNESGKSVILEMIAFALWGVQALRVSATGYKKDLNVELEFTARGNRYRVERTLKNATIYDNAGEPMATGTKPVNQRIVELFGYGYPVYAMANACLQGQIEKLSDSLPAERKKLVDQTIGLHILDGIADDLGKEALEKRRRAEGMAEVLVRPQEPQQPQDYLPEVVLVEQLTQARPLVDEFRRLKAELATVPVEPQQPVSSVLETVDTLQLLIDERQVLRGQVLEASATAQRRMQARDALSKPVKRVVPDLVFPELKLPELVVPKYTPAELDELRSQHHQHQAWLSKQKLIERGEHVCPACAHHWPVAEELEHPDWKAVVECEAPALTLAQINAEAKVVSNEAVIEQLGKDHALRWERMKEQHEYDEAKAETDFNQASLEYEEAMEAASKLLSETMVELEELTLRLEAMPDRAADLRTRREFDAAMVSFNEQQRVYNNFMADYPRKQARMVELENSEAEVESLITRLAHVKQYDIEIAAFATTLADYEAKVALKDSILEEADGLARARLAVQEAKVVIKSFLVPSLNQVSSLLLSQMTGGVRNNITISEDFDIQVDGSDIATLSGSGKAVANLAIRIGLGQIMTNNIFSSFQADEVDEGMDEERAAFTAECLRRLSPNIRQVILVTHKRPIADHIYELPLKQ